MAEIAVASNVVILPIGEIKPYHRNARENSVTVDKLVEIIPKVGFNQPLLLDRDNIIVKGHSRWKAAIRLGMKALPCLYTDADPETVKLDRLADNRLHEFSSWDEELLGSELASLNLPFSFDLGSLDFSIDLGGSFVPPPTEPAQPSGEAGGEPSGAAAQPFITAQDVVKTVGSALNNKDYIEIICNHCGERLWVERPEPKPRSRKSATSSPQDTPGATETPAGLSNAEAAA